jgi:hypothetical protein
LPDAEPRVRARVAKFFRGLLEGKTVAVALAKADLTWGEYHVHEFRNAGLQELYSLITAIQRAIIKAKRENALQKRAVDGWLEPVWWKGKKVGTVRRFSDRLLEKALAASDPDTYGDRQQSQVSLDVAVSFQIHGVDHSRQQEIKTIEAEDISGNPVTKREQTAKQGENPNE